VIMAGGSGERFWPLSRMKKPKQLLRLTHPTVTMIEEAIARVEPLIPVDRILIITSAILRQPIIDALPHVPEANVIAEPAKRNTAPCLALACSVINAREQGDACMVVLTADHFIGNAEDFRADIQRALSFSETHPALVTMGIPPTRPETGYGYIDMAEKSKPHAIVKVSAFKEKPDFETALEYVVSGTFLWNSGMFFWRTSVLQSAMMSHLKDVGSKIVDMTLAITSSDHSMLASLFEAMPNISIDYGLMERAPNVFVLPASFPWDDVGSWDALERMQPMDAKRNVVQGDAIVVETSSSIIVNAHTNKHTITTIGIDSVVVVSTDDATMICSKDKAQDVKKIVATLRDLGRDDLL